MKTDAQILEAAVLHEDVAPGIHEPARSGIRRAIDIAGRLGLAKARVATWPDGAWAVLLFNPDWQDPRAEQIVRAYRAAVELGLRLHPLEREAA